MKSLSHVQIFATPWTVAYQAPLSMGFSRQEYWSGLPLPSPGDLSDSRIEPGSPALQADTLPSKPRGKYYVGIYFKAKEKYSFYSYIKNSAFIIYLFLNYFLNDRISQVS